jgi:hypothetical protein
MQTVVCFPTEPQAPFPEFSLRPEYISDKIAAVFGCVDINFPDDPAFSGKFRLHGRDEEAVRRLFDASVRGFLVRDPALHVESVASGLIVYRPGVRVEPAQLRTFLDSSCELLSLFAGNFTLNP